jgi:hypothetical protein
MSSFVEICIYEVKPEKVDEFEILLKDVYEHHKSFDGVIDVRYMKRTHRQKDFNSVKNGEPAIRLIRKPKSVKYVLFWEIEDEYVHGKATKSGLEKFYKRFNRFLLTMPKIIVGDRLL